MGDFRWVVFARGTCLSSHAARAFGFRANSSGQPIKRDGRADTRQRAARPRNENASRPDSSRGIAGNGAAAGRAALGTGCEGGRRQPQIQCLELFGCPRPARVLGVLESAKFTSEGWKNRFLREFVLTLSRTDFEEATALAETIADPATAPGVGALGRSTAGR